MAGPEHECRQGRKCDDRIRDAAGEWHGAGVERPDTLCQYCEKRAFDALGQLWDDYKSLEAAIVEPRGRVDGPKIRKTADRKIPIPLDVDSLMMAIDDETLRWAIRVTKGDPLPGTPRDRVRQCVRILRSSTGTLVDLPRRRVAAWMPYPDGGDYDGLLELDGVDAVLRLADLHRRAQSTLGLTESKTERLNDPCHVCGLALLMMDISESIIKCRGCWNCWSEEEFARLNNPMAAA